MTRRQIVATTLEAGGAVAVTGAAFGLSELLGLLVAGVALIVFGVATELGGS